VRTNELLPPVDLMSERVFCYCYFFTTSIPQAFDFNNSVPSDVQVVTAG
jgi:hypothetical protein